MSTNKLLGEFLWMVWFMCVGFFICYTLVKPSDQDEINAILSRKVIQECQKDLPRSQVCELTAKVKESGK